MQDNSNVKRSLLKPAPPTSSPNTSNGKYISPKTTKILNNNASHNAASTGKYLNTRSSNTSSNNTSLTDLEKPVIAKEDSVECLFEV